jgi:hypothetical protein
MDVARHSLHGVEQSMTAMVVLGCVVAFVAATLFVRDRLRAGFGRRFIEPVARTSITASRFLRPIVHTIVVVFRGWVLLFALSENWGTIVCWLNDETGSLSRTCALHKIVARRGFGDAYVVSITGIANVSENVKRVEFEWHAKDASQSPSPSSVSDEIVFRRYDDGWRPEGKRR